MRLRAILCSGLFFVLSLTANIWQTAGAGLPFSPECFILNAFPDVAVHADPEPPIYYKIDLKTTRKVPGARLATGVGNVTFAPSPFGVAISPNGTYVYDLDIAVERITAQTDKAYAVWVTTPDLKQVHFLGTLDENNRIRGRVDWNKFLVVVSLESTADEFDSRWSGPIVLRGMSRSGMMHTMAGHGPYVTEPCAVYGYN